MKFNSLAEAEKELAKYIPQVKELLGKDLTLDRMRPMLDILDNPQDKLKIVHVAGTSGKTSTTYYIASLLRESGQKVGHTVSPHIDSITERVQINLNPIDENEFCNSLAEFLNLINATDLKPTYFELLIGYIYWYFAKVGVDYAVIETGLGGSFDATNVAGKSDKICVITDIGMDHMHVLGNSLTEIASQKAGIIHYKNQVFINDQPNQIIEVFKLKCQKQSAILNVLSMPGDYGGEFTDMPDFQKRNFKLAKSVFDYIATRDSLPKLTSQQIDNCRTTKVPGRMDVVRLGTKTLIMDGAHNQQKMDAFVSSFRSKYPDQKPVILLSLKEGKEHKDVLPILKPICSKLIITTFNTSQDLPAKSIDTSLLADEATKIGIENIVINDHKRAYQHLINSNQELLIITGSFYLLSQVRKFIISSND